MSRKVREEFVPDEPRIAIGTTRKKDEPQVVDAYVPLPGAMRQLNSQPEHVKVQTYTAQQEFARYAQLLVKHKGDPVPAIAELRGLSESDVASDLPRLREELHTRAAGTDLSTLLEKHDVSLVNQIAVLRNWMYDNHAAPSLKAVELLREIEGKAGQRRQGQRAEDLIRLALGSADD